MKILFDHGTPAPLRRSLPNHDVATAYEQGWADLTNGDLLTAAEAAGFEMLVTTDQNLRYQQNLTTRNIAILVLPYASWPKLSRRIPEIVAAIESLHLRGFAELPR